MITQRHHDEAERLALLVANDIEENCIEYEEIPQSDELQTAMRERLLAIIPLANLLAAQEENDALRKVAKAAKFTRDQYDESVICDLGAAMGPLYTALAELTAKGITL